jgi:hypothetical protein
MTAPTRIEYEAHDIDVHATKDLCVLVMLTDKGRVALHMRRTVFDHLCEHIDAVRVNEGKRVPRH